MLNDEQLLRYSRHILLPDIDIAGQQRLNQARVLILGLGGLGSPAALYLASAGIGTLILADHDQVELSNLQRQIIHTTDRIGMAKVASARLALQAINPDCRIETLNQRLDAASLTQQVARVDLVLDCSDNFATRFALNRACVQQQTPLISGAAIRMEGQVTLFDPRTPNSPCYHCLYQETDEQAPSCAEAGVLAPLVGIIGAIQALEAIKLLTNTGQTLTGRLLLLDAKTLQWRTVQIQPDPACPVCR